MEDLLEGIAKGFGLVVVGIGTVFMLSLILVLPVWLLWNWIAPLIWGWTELSLIQAWGLTLLCGCLFRSSNSSSKS